MPENILEPAPPRATYTLAPALPRILAFQVLKDSPSPETLGSAKLSLLRCRWKGSVFMKFHPLGESMLILDVTSPMVCCSPNPGALAEKIKKKKAQREKREERETVREVDSMRCRSSLGV